MIPKNYLKRFSLKKTSTIKTNVDMDPIVKIVEQKDPGETKQTILESKQTPIDLNKIDLENDQQKANEKQDITNLYNNWKLDPSSQNLSLVIKSLQPTVNYALASYQGSGDPYIETQAKILTSKAIKAFDPSYNVSLPTFLTSRLRKLTRIVRDARSPIKIPERTVYAIAELQEAEKELMEKNGGREPDVQQLADHMRVPVKKIEAIRRKMVKQVSEGSYFGGESGEMEDSESPDSLDSLKASDESQIDFTKEAMRYLHNESDYREKKILEWTTGYGGSKILTPSQIASKLGISESQVSRLTAKIAVKLSSTMSSLEKVYGG